MEILTMIFALIDDTSVDRQKLYSILTEYAAHHSGELILRCFSSGEEFLKNFRPCQYAAVFLDIYMGGMTGLETAQIIRKTDADLPLVFITSSSEHMADAFRFHAYEYVTKPFDRSRIFQLMDDLMKRTTKEENLLSFVANRETHNIPYSDILFVRSSDHYAEIMTKQGHNYITRMNFSSICEQLSTDPRFLLIIRGVLVNMDSVIRFADHSCYLENGFQLPANVKNCKQIEQIWKNYIFQKIRSEHMPQGGLP